MFHLSILCFHNFSHGALGKSRTSRTKTRQPCTSHSAHMDRSTGGPELRTPRHTTSHDAVIYMSMGSHGHSIDLSTYGILWTFRCLCLDFACRLSQLANFEAKSLCRAPAQSTPLAVIAWKSVKKTCQSRVWSQGDLRLALFRKDASS